MITDILLRSVANPPLVTKGSILTYAEEDGNFIEIYEFLAALNNGSGVTIYNPATNYLGTYYVSYANNIWLHVASSSTGVTPGTNPAVWELTTIGALAHQQGTDMFVGLGSPYETTAQEIYDLVNSVVITVTESAFIALYNSGTMQSNKIYAVTDCALTPDAADSPILYIHSLSSSTVNSVCAMTLRMPDYSQDLFVLTKWDATATYTAGAKVCIDGLVYRNLTGTNSTTLPSIDAINWGLEVQSTNFYITKKYGNVQIKITTSIEVDFFTDLATNTVYSGFDLQQKYLDSTATIAYSQARSINCSIGKLNRLTGSNSNYVILDGDNCVIAIPVGGNSFLQNVMLIDSEIDLGNFFAYGNIQNLHLKHVALNFPDGCDTGVSGLSIELNNLSVINIPASTGILIGGTVDNKGSDVEFSATIPASTTLDLDTLCNGYSDVFGVFKLDTNSPIVDTIVRACRLFPIKLIPYGGNTIGISRTTPNSATAGRIISPNDFTLLSNNADYVILEPITINVGGGDIDVWQVKEYKNNT